MFPVSFEEIIARPPDPGDTYENLSFSFLPCFICCFTCCLFYMLFLLLFVLLFLFSVLFVSRLKTGEIVIVAVCDVQNDDLLLLADPAQHNESKKK